MRTALTAVNHSRQNRPNLRWPTALRVILSASLVHSLSFVAAAHLGRWGGHAAWRMCLRCTAYLAFYVYRAYLRPERVAQVSFRCSKLQQTFLGQGRDFFFIYMGELTRSLLLLHAQGLFLAREGQGRPGRARGSGDIKKPGYPLPGS